MRVVINRITPLFPVRVFLQWDLEETDESGDYTFDVERSGSPEGPWDKVAINLINSFNYMEDLDLNKPFTSDKVYEGLNLFRLENTVYYRVLATPPSGRANAVYSDPHLIENALNKNDRLLRRKIMYDETVGLKKLSGVELMVLKKRHWGIRCEDCFDLVTREVLQEDCGDCYATGFKGGFFAPVRIYGRLSDNPVQTQTAPQGIVETYQPRLTVLDYPKLDAGDIIVDLRRNDRYEVKIVLPTTLKQVIIHQEATISLLGRDAVQYLVPVDPYTTPSLY
jgi:hypothetical protein